MRGKNLIFITKIKMDFQTTNIEFIKKMLLKVWFQDDANINLLIDQTLEIFNDWLQSEILSSLSNEQMERFDSLVSANPADEQIYDFFNKSIDWFDSFMDWLYDKFENMYISEYKKNI